MFSCSFLFLWHPNLLRDIVIYKITQKAAQIKLNLLKFLWSHLNPLAKETPHRFLFFSCKIFQHCIQNCISSEWHQPTKDSVCVESHSIGTNKKGSHSPAAHTTSQQKQVAKGNQPRRIATALRRRTEGANSF